MLRPSGLRDWRRRQRRLLRARCPDERRRVLPAPPRRREPQLRSLHPAALTALSRAGGALVSAPARARHGGGRALRRQAPAAAAVRPVPWVSPQAATAGPARRVPGGIPGRPDGRGAGVAL